MTIDPSIVVAVVGGAAAIIAAAVTALVTRRTHRDADLRTDLDRLMSEVAALRSENRTLADYTHLLRGDCEAAGIPVRPWPDGLTTT